MNPFLATAFQVIASLAVLFFVVVGIGYDDHTKPNEFDID